MSAQSGRIPAAEPAPWLRGLHTLVYVVAPVWHCQCVHDGLAGMSPDGERIIIVQTKVARPNCPTSTETGTKSGEGLSAQSGRIPARRCIPMRDANLGPTQLAAAGSRVVATRCATAKLGPRFRASVPGACRAALRATALLLRCRGMPGGCLGS